MRVDSSLSQFDVSPPDDSHAAGDSNHHEYDDIILRARCGIVPGVFTAVGVVISVVARLRPTGEPFEQPYHLARVVASSDWSSRCGACRGLDGQTGTRAMATRGRQGARRGGVPRRHARDGKPPPGPRPRRRFPEGHVRGGGALVATERRDRRRRATSRTPEGRGETTARAWIKTTCRQRCGVRTAPRQPDRGISSVLLSRPALART